MLVGLLCLLGAFARLGFLADLLSRPVLVGYMAGVAVLMIVGQLGKVTRLPVNGDSIVAEVGSFARQLGQVHLPTVLLAAVVTAVFSLRDSGVQVIGEIHWFLLNAEANVEIDITAADAIEALRTDLVRRGIVFAMARVKQDLRAELASAGLVERIGEDRIFPTLPTALAAFRDRVR